MNDEVWWIRILGKESLTAREHTRIAEEMMAFSQRTAEANPEKGYECVRDETERAKVHAMIALAKSQAER